ncbi:MAG TPA: class I SAM-dependent methyltransferase [Polyangia bacterium]|nr:class I SAM-dependent methyltransferase [Polyangia bacterium]
MSENPYDLADGRGMQSAIRLAGRFANRARSRRYDWYLRTMRPARDERLLDVGCGGSWSLAERDPEAMVTGVDLIDRGGFERPNQRFVAADACKLPFEDDSFDLAYSNSLVEHIAVERRPDFAAEIRRVARRYWVQTPNYWFPIEPHALLPGAQFLPEPARRVAWRASPRGIDYEDSLRLLKAGELARLFPDALILHERAGPLTKSLVAVGPRELFRERR